MSSRRPFIDNKSASPIEWDTEAPEDGVDPIEATAAPAVTKNKVRCVTILKDLILGIYLGAILIAISIFLDYIDILHFQSAHNFRNAAYEMLDNPETIATIEESAELKFMNVNEYESIREEMHGVGKLLANREEYIQDKTKVADQNHGEIESIRSEHDEIMLKSKTVLELDKFCEECIWQPKSTTCLDRVNFLIQRYKMSAPAAKVAAMDMHVCKRTTPPQNEGIGFPIL